MGISFPIKGMRSIQSYRDLSIKQVLDLSSFAKLIAKNPAAKISDNATQLISRVNNSIQNRTSLQKLLDVISFQFIKVIILNKRLPLLTQKLDDKDGQVWKCIGKKPDPSGGYIQLYKYNPAYSNQINEIFPAIEPSEMQLDFLKPGVNLDLWKTEVVIGLMQYLSGEYLKKVESQVAALAKYVDIIKELGFSYGHDNIFHAPDNTVLKARWEKLRQRRPELPVLDFVPLKEDGNDRDFAKAHINHHGVFSDKKEFIHDIIFHVLGKLVLMLDENHDFNAENTRLQTLIKTIDAKIEMAHTLSKDLRDEDIALNTKNLEMFEAAFGAFVDEMSSSFDYSTEGGTGKYTLQYFEKFIQTTWYDEPWKSYWIKRFGNFGLSSFFMLVAAVNSVLER